MKIFARKLVLWLLALVGPPLISRLYLYLYYTGALTHSLLLLCAVAAFPGAIAVGVWLLYVALAKWPAYRAPTSIIYAALMFIGMLMQFRVVACFSYGDCM